MKSTFSTHWKSDVTLINFGVLQFSIFPKVGNIGSQKGFSTVHVVYNLAAGPLLNQR